MHILQCGMEKSGNSWLHKIIQEIINLSGQENNSFIRSQKIHKEISELKLSLVNQQDIDVLDIMDSGCYYRVSSIFREPVINIDDYINSCTHVWTHSKFSIKARPVFSRFTKIIYIVRDPRDVAISMSNFVFTSYMRKYYPKSAEKYSNPTEYLSHNLEYLILRWMSHVWGYLKNQQEFDIYFVFYERLLINFEEELDFLLNYLDIDLSSSNKERIKIMTSFKQMSSDNKDHLRKAELYDHMDFLSLSEKKSSLGLSYSFLDAFNYPLETNVEKQKTENNFLPYVKNNLDYSNLFRSLVLSKIKYLANPIYLPRRCNNLISKIWVT